MLWRDGYISHEVFNGDLEDFAERSRSLGDDWEVRLAPDCLQLDQQPVKYLVKRSCRQITNGSATLSTETDSIGTELTISEYDDCELSRSVSPQNHANYEFHITYSQSYGVPVLYFITSKPDGCPLNLDDIWKSIPDIYQQRLQEERWTFLTQQEHPILQKPFFQLHPCHTADMMKNTVMCTDPKEEQQHKRKPNYLITWLSSVGPIVGLHLPMEYIVNF